MEIFKKKNISDSSLNKLNSIIEFWAKTISEELAERRFFEVEDFTAFVKIRLFQSISDCVKIDVQELESERARMVEEFGKAKGRRKLELGTKISKINLEKKRANRLKHSLKDYDEYRQLTIFIKERYGWNVMKDFYDNFLDRPENVKNKMKD